MNTEARHCPSPLTSRSIAGSPMLGAVRCLGHLAREGNSELRLDALQCISSLMTVQRDDHSEPDTRVEVLCETWFQELDSQPLEFLLKISKKPFKDHRLAVLLVYRGLASQAWAQQVN